MVRAPTVTSWPAPISLSNDSAACVARVRAVAARRRASWVVRARVHQHRVVQRIGREVFGQDGQRFGGVGVGEFQFADVEPVADEVLREHAGVLVLRPEQRAAVGQRGLEHLDAARQVAGHGQRAGIHGARLDHAGVRWRFAVHGDGQAIGAFAAVAREVELVGVQVREHERHRVRDPLRVALAEPSRREFGTLAGKLFGLGVLAQVDRGERPVHQRGGELDGAAADPRAQCRQHTVEIGTGLLRPPTKAMHLRLQHQRAQSLCMGGAERPGRFGHRARDHRLGRSHVTQREQAFADHVRQLDARAGLARERRVEPFVGLLQQIDRAELLRAAARVRAGLAKDRGDEILDVLGTLALRHRNAGLPERRAGAADAP